MQKMIMGVLAAFIFAPIAASAQGVYRCGSSYQSQPCANGSGSEVKIQAGNSASTGSSSAKGGLNEADFNRCYIKNEACKGMNMAQLERSFGKPYKINSSTGSYGYHEQRIYTKGADEYYVYTENGIVTGIQHQPGAAAIFGSASSNRAPKECPSALEIRNAEVSANSISIDEYKRRVLLKQISEMKRCALEN